ncbi:DUF2459 domain-containing protein [Ruegeria faecimaris]|uniref:DUF2459 domain-containing protein n=1 Tax=Ruegeria faecimaris TaxID=686389 RepID=UPI0024916216|nr:DUF2459 domain-containing protein [Ruegeria faecimaris]
MCKAAGRFGLCLIIGAVGYFLAAAIGMLLTGSGNRAQGDDTIEIAWSAGRSTGLLGAGFFQPQSVLKVRGRFNALRTCNVWAGEVLWAANEDFGTWVPLPYSITLSRLINQSGKV